MTNSKRINSSFKTLTVKANVFRFNSFLGKKKLFNSQLYQNAISKLLVSYTYTSCAGSITVRIHPAYSRGQICREIC